jgi:TRAP-type mannitol/chloroaromatic compound transport system substrate-binding protein
VNLQAWRRLPGEYRAMFATACQEANITMLSRYEALNGAALKRLVAGGTETLAYGEDILTAAREASDQILADSAAADPEFRRLHDQWRAFQKEVSAWNRLNELAFARFTFGREGGS